MTSLKRALAALALFAALPLASAVVIPAAAAPAISATPSTQVSAPARSSAAARPKYAWCWRRHHRCYSAATINLATGRAFWVSNKVTRSNAISTAWRRCRAKATPSRCVRAGWVTNGTLAVYYLVRNGVPTQWASGIAYGLTGARRAASRHLIGQGTRKYWTWTATDRSTRYRVGGHYSFGDY